MKKIILLFIAALNLFYPPINAQHVVNEDSLRKTIQLDEVVISVSKSEEKRADVPYEIELIKSKDVELTTPQTSADMLQNTGSVFVQKSQQGGGSPVLRGFEASRVLIVVDGVRMNNAIYRSGHLQDVITLDNSMLERTEIVFGPSSVIYGSDALGGVMHFITRKPIFGDDSLFIKGNSYARWSSANNEMTGHIDFNLGWKKFASLTGITYSDFDDLRSGKRYNDIYDMDFERTYYVENINGTDSMVRNSDPNIQKFSGYWQHDVLQKFAYRQSENILHALSFHFSNSSDIPRYDRLTEYNGNNLLFAEWYYGPQTRILASLKSEIISGANLFDKLNTTLAWQSISQDRINRKFGSNDKTYQMEDVAVYSLNADLGKTLNETHELHYGLEGTFNDVQSEAKTVNTATGAETPAATRYPDGGSTMSSYAAYLSHRFRVSEKIIVSEGIRFSGSSLTANFNDTTFFPFPYTEINQNSTSLTGNAGLVIKPNAEWRISVVGSSGFRTPNVDDLTKIFSSTSGLLVVANPDLKPENAYNVELTIEKYYEESVRISLTGWYTKLVNAMVQKDFQYNGQDSVLYDGVMSRVQAIQNADDAEIQGITGSLAADLSEQISFYGTATYTYGRYHDTENDTILPLDHIPPVFGKVSFSFKTKKLNTEFYVLFNREKKIKDYSPSGEDNLQYATPIGMPSWATLNIKAQFYATKVLTLQAGIENIMDTHYRYFASGISAPGRNVTVTMRAKF